MNDTPREPTMKTIDLNLNRPTAADQKTAGRDSGLSAFSGISTLFGLVPMRPLPKHKDPALKAYLEHLKKASPENTRQR